MLRMNKVFQAGNLTADPEIRTTGTGTPVCNFRIAVNTRISDDKQRVMYIDCAAFGKLAEAVFQYCRKGSQVLVEGRLDEDTWVAENGDHRFKHYITAYEVSFLSYLTPSDAQAPAQNDDIDI